MYASADFFELRTLDTSCFILCAVSFSCLLNTALFRFMMLAFCRLSFSGTYIMASPWELTFQHWEPSSTHRKCFFTTMGIGFHIVFWGCLFEASPKYRPPELGPPEVLIPLVACVGVSCQFGITSSGGYNSRFFSVAFPAVGV